MQEKEQQWAQWMQAAIAGDRASYRALLDALIPLVTAWARRALLGNGRDLSELEDIVQESFLAIHLKRHMWDPARPLVPWLRAIVSNKAIDVLRRKGHRVSVPIETFENVLAVMPVEPELRAEELARLIAHLDGGQRRIVEAIAVDGQSLREAALSLGIPEGTARVLLHRGLKRLAAIYRKNCP